MTHVLVTGGSGFTGRRLVGALMADGERVRVLTRAASRTAEILPGVPLIEGDVADPEAVRRSTAGVSRIYHLAAAFNEAGIPDRRYRTTHVDGTRLLLEAARAEGVDRFVHVSTVGVHGHVESPPADEEYPRQPADIYQETKNEAELVALRYQREHGLPVTVIRPTPIYGPGDLRLLKLFKMIQGGLFVMLGKGEVCFHLVHVDDLVQGMRLAAVNPAAVGEVFIIGGERYESLDALTRRIARLLRVRPPRFRVPLRPVYWLSAVVERVCVALRVEPPLYRRRVSFFMHNRAFSIEKARRILGYRPRIDLDTGLRETIEWYRTQGYLDRPEGEDVERAEGTAALDRSRSSEEASRSRRPARRGSAPPEERPRRERPRVRDASASTSR